MSDQIPENAAMTAHAGLPPAIFLVGFMGAGKSSVGRELAVRLGRAFVDLDDRVIAREGRTIADVFRDDGEAAFRKMESRALAEVIEEVRNGASAVVALGGGAYVQPENAQTIGETGFPVVFLDAALDELRCRCAQNGATRPLFQDEERFQQLYESRRTYYLKANVRIDTTSRPVGAVVEDVLQVLRTKK
jgi:shikimate kinase